MGLKLLLFDVVAKIVCCCCKIFGYSFMSFMGYFMRIKMFY